MLEKDFETTDLEPTVTQGQASSESPETSETQVGFDFQKLENQLLFNRAIEKGKEVVIHDGKNGKNKRFLQECGGRKRKSSQKSGDQTAEGVRSDTGTDRETFADPSDRKGQGAGGNNSPTYYKKWLEENRTGNQVILLEPAYVKEWVEGSGVHRGIVALNVWYCEGYQALNCLLYSDRLRRTNPGWLYHSVQKKYQHVEAGGWWCSGTDILTGEDSDWGCFKADKPRIDFTKAKPIKYEHPPKEPTGVFALRVTEEISAKIFEKNGLDPLDDVPPGDKEDELFWPCVKADENIPIIITEGAKKAGALLSAGYAAIAVPGIWNGSRKNKNGKHTLIPELEALAIPGRTFYLAFDQDQKRSTRRSVRTALGRLAWLLKEKGCKEKDCKEKDCKVKVKVIEWEPTFKGVDDLIVAKGEAYFDECYRKALDFDYWKTRWLSQLTYKPTIKLDGSKQYIGDFSFVVPESEKLICIKAPKGSGKTEWMAKICEDAQCRGQRVLILSHRTQLVIALSNRFGVDCVSELKTSDTKGLLGIGLCFDSLKKDSQARFDPEEWHDAILILDECEQSIWHLLSAKTQVANARIEVLQNFQQLIINILSSEEGRIFLADADLSDVSIDYIRELSGIPIKPWVLLKEGMFEPWNVTIWESPQELMARLEADLRDGGKVWISTDSQKPKAKWGTRTLEAYLIKRFFGKRILIIDRQTIQNPQHPAFDCMRLVNPQDKTTILDILIPQYDVVIASPSVETGVSVDIRGHFTGVYGFFLGTIPVSSALQAIARVREPVPRHLWLSSRGLGMIGNGSYSIQSLKESHDDIFKADLLALTKAGISDAFDFEASAQFQPQSLSTYLKMAARINAGTTRYRENIITDLLLEGHNVVGGTPEQLDDLDAPTPQDVKEQVTASRDRIYLEHLHKIANAKNPDKEEYELLKEKRQKNDQEQIEYEKGKLSRRYSAELASNVELIKADDEGKHSKWRLQYYLTKGREFLPGHDLNIFTTRLSEDGAFFLPDINRQTKGGKILILEVLGILKLLEPGTEWSNKSEILVNLKAEALKWRQKIKNVFHLTIMEKDTPITVAQKLLKLIDRPLQFSKRVGARGQRDRIYQALEVPSLTQAVFEVWLERDRAALEEKIAGEQSRVHDGDSNNNFLQVDTDKVDTTSENQIGVHDGYISNIFPTVDTEEVDTTSENNLGSHAGQYRSIIPTVTTDEVTTTPEQTPEKTVQPVRLSPEEIKWYANCYVPLAIQDYEGEDFVNEVSHLISTVYRVDLEQIAKACDKAIWKSFREKSGIVLGSLLPSGEMTPDKSTTPTRKRLFIIPQRVSQKVAAVASAAVVAGAIAGGLPASAVPAVATPNAQSPVTVSQEAVQVREHHWDELPKPGAIVRWVDRGGTEKLILKSIDPDGRCQVKSLSTGWTTNTRVDQLKPDS